MIQQEPTEQELSQMRNHFANSQYELLGIGKSKQPNRTRREVYPTVNEVSCKQKYNVPIINIRATMANFYKFLDSYNDSVIDTNHKIEVHNKIIAYNLKQFATTQNIYNVAHFQELYKSKQPEIYNLLVDQQDGKFKKFLQKRKLQKIKANTILFFNTFLYLYKYQIENENNFLSNAKRPTYRILTKYDLNQNNVKKHRTDGVQKFKHTELKTIKRHKDVLIAKGIFKNYKFRGRQKSVLVEFSKDILVVNDQNPNFYDNTNYQLVNIKLDQKADDIKHILINNNKINLKRSKSENLKLCLADGLQNFGSESQNKKPVEEKRKKIAEKKEKVNLVSNYQFANEMQNSKISQPIIAKCSLTEVATRKNILKDNFAKLLAQQIMLFAFIKIYKNHKFIKMQSGNIQNTLKLITKKFMVNNSWYVNKEMQLKTYFEIIDAISYASNQIESKNYKKTLHPFAWFDPNRNKKEDGGLQYILFKLRKQNQHQETTKNISVLKINRLKTASEKRKQNRYERMYYNAINRYQQGKYENFAQLTEYINSNLPKKYLQKLVFYTNN